MNDLQCYDFNKDRVRAFEEGGEIFFVVNDVCEALKYTKSRKAILDHVDKEDVTKRYVLSKGGEQEFNVSAFPIPP